MYITPCIYHKSISWDFAFRANVWVLLKLQKCAQLISRVVDQGQSLNRSNAYVGSFANVYSMITKLILVTFKSQKTPPSTLTTGIGIIIIKQSALLSVLLDLCSLLVI